MKNLQYNWFSILISILLLSGCSADYLTRPPVDSITDINFYKTDAEVMAGTALLYNRVWFDYNSVASFGLGDFRGGVAMDKYAYYDNVQMNATGDSQNNNSAWNSFFTVIGQSNLAILNINKYAGAAVTEPVKKEAIAEARFMRAVAYRDLVLTWGEVPIITNNQTVLGDTSITKNTVSSIWKFLTTEMRACENDLPLIPYATGRVTKWSAEGMLARFYLSRAGVESVNGVRNKAFLDSAAYYSNRVIQLSGKSLLSDYATLFKYPYNNNNESLFELQWVFSTIWGVSNSAPAALTNGDADFGLGNGGDGWGGSITATWWMLQQYDGIIPVGVTGDSIQGRTIDQRFKATFMLPGFTYPELVAHLTKADGSTIDTIFVVPNNSAQVTSANDKKYVVGKLPAAVASSQHYPNDTYMMRLAEMYLIYSEATLGDNSETSDPTALAYFNAIRTRAGLSPLNKPTISFDDIFKERNKEFAMEGMLWYDLSSMYYYNPAKALGILNTQDRNEFGIYVDKYPNPTMWTFVKTPWDTQRIYPVASGNFLLPIPNNDLAGAPNLSKPAVDYYNK